MLKGLIFSFDSERNNIDLKKTVSSFNEKLNVFNMYVFNVINKCI